MWCHLLLWCRFVVVFKGDRWTSSATRYRLLKSSASSVIVDVVVSFGAAALHQGGARALLALAANGE